MVVEDPGGAEQHRGVRVVAAGVHLPGHLAPVLPLHFLLKRNIARGFSYENVGSEHMTLTAATRDVNPLTDASIRRDEDVRASVVFSVLVRSTLTPVVW